MSRLASGGWIVWDRREWVWREEGQGKKRGTDRREFGRRTNLNTLESSPGGVESPGFQSMGVPARQVTWGRPWGGQGNAGGDATGDFGKSSSVRRGSYTVFPSGSSHTHAHNVSPAQHRVAPCCADSAIYGTAAGTTIGDSEVVDGRYGRRFPASGIWQTLRTADSKYVKAPVSVGHHRSCV